MSIDKSKDTILVVLLSFKMPSNKPRLCARPTRDEEVRIRRLADSYGLSVSQYLIKAALAYPQLEEKVKG